MNKVELEFAPGLWMEFTNRDRALKQVEEWAEKSTWRPVVVFGPEGCGKTALLLQASAMLRELAFEVFYLHPLERKFEAEVDLPDLKSEFMRFVERALGENALGRITWAAVDFIRKLQKARQGKIAVIADDVFQAIGLDAAATYVKALLNLIEYPESRYEKIVVLVTTSEGASRREIGRHRCAHLAPMWNMSMERFRQLYERIPGPKRPAETPTCSEDCTRPVGTSTRSSQLLQGRRYCRLPSWPGGAAGLNKPWRTPTPSVAPRHLRS
jgi:energy-coupling factor transporter ATP-binding protein EcfA2